MRRRLIDILWGRSAETEHCLSLGLARALAIVVTAVGLGLPLAFPAETKGGIIPIGADDAPYVSLGSQYAGRTVYVVGNYPGGGVTVASGVLIDPYDVLTAGHVARTFISGGATSEYIGTGPNYSTNVGTRVLVSSYVISPAYTGNYQDNGSIDLAVLHLSQPIGNTYLSIGSALSGEILTGSGYGEHGDASGSSLTNDGNIRSGNAPMTITGMTDASPQYYFHTLFGSGLASQNWNAYSGDSGGGWYNSAGQLDAITVGGSVNVSSFMFTTELNLSQPDIENWIDANTDSVAPEPSSVALLGLLATGAFLRRQRHA